MRDIINWLVKLEKYLSLDMWATTLQIPIFARKKIKFPPIL
ncbi:hypothetical protein PCIT_b1032 [Pseudoalteromonas citrea]|uniref:Uncharacterized protein n=1 Tax=Pseudoalteromonas citrea TaxID=43655 RepID=A0AAD4FQC5_9GAMM|nr:hypothetical protein PCIT_b1032 [Pseudoalteromonas citrea]